MNNLVPVFTIKKRTHIKQKRSSSKLSPSRILLIDDDPICLRIYSEALRASDFIVSMASKLKEALGLIEKEGNFATILLDIHLPDTSDTLGMEAIKAASPSSILIVLTSDEQIEQAIHFMNNGADDFLLKKNDVLANVAKIRLHLPTNEKLTTSFKKHINYQGIVSESPKIIQILKSIDHLKEASSPILIIGESGVGKERIAHYIHNTSSRSTGPFVALNCAAIAPSLFEAELFGYKKGSFTDAKKDKKGFFELCNNGTLFLDEIGELPLALQAKLLRAVESSEVTPVGSCTPVKINTRIVSATNRNLDPMNQQSQFRKDLYYRLSVFKFSIPPLRERSEDIALLVDFFVEEFSNKYHKTNFAISEANKRKLFDYSWPGNVRELKNCIERIVALSSEDFDYMDKLILTNSSVELDPASNSEMLSKKLKKLPFDEAENIFRKEYLMYQMKKHRENITEVAKAADKSRMWVYRMNAKA